MSTLLPFVRRSIRVKTERAPAPQATECRALLDEFIVARPADIPALTTWLRCALRTDPKPHTRPR
jgi:hypothetical protein